MAEKYLNKKQELFCQFIAGGSTQAEAYELAGYEPSSANASTLFNKPLVQKRIGELKAEAERRENEFRVLAERAKDADPETAAQIARGAEWNAQRILDMMGENVRLAQIAGEYKAANECLKMMAEATQLLGAAKAKGGEGQLPGGGNLALVGQLTQILQQGGRAGDPDAEDEGPVNPLQPKKG